MRSPLALLPHEGYYPGIVARRATIGDLYDPWRRGRSAPCRLSFSMHVSYLKHQRTSPNICPYWDQECPCSVFWWRHQWWRHERISQRARHMVLFSYRFPANRRLSLESDARPKVSEALLVGNVRFVRSVMRNPSRSSDRQRWLVRHQRLYAYLSWQQLFITFYYISQQQCHPRWQSSRPPTPNVATVIPDSTATDAPHSLVHPNNCHSWTLLGTPVLEATGSLATKFSY